jgi:hypothetical protein
MYPDDWTTGIPAPFHHPDLRTSETMNQSINFDLQHNVLAGISSHLKTDGVFICTLQNPAVRLKTADGITRRMGEFRLDDDKKMIISYMNQLNPTTGIVSGVQIYELFDNSDKLTERRILEINFKPVSDSEFKSLIKPLDFEIINRYGDYSGNEFDEETSDFLIYKLKKVSSLS